MTQLVARSRSTPDGTMFAATVVLPVFNGAHCIGAQLEALARQDFEGRWEIVVVDNGSTDGTSELVREWETGLPNLRLIAHADRAGFPGMAARNTGIIVARSDRILLCDMDDVVATGWVRALVRALETFDLVGGKLEYELLNDRSVILSRDHIQTGALPSHLGHLVFASTANAGLHRRDFVALGGFDTSVGEADFCWRAQYAGFTIGFAPDAVVHYRFRSSRAALMSQVRGYSRHAERLYVKHRRMGYIASPPVSRYKVAAARAARLVTSAPCLLSGRKRLRYWRNVARLVGSLQGITQNGFLVLDPDLRRPHRLAAPRSSSASDKAS